MAIAPTQDVIETYVKPKLEEFLAGNGLSFSEAKTRIRHITEGFSFLGFRFQRFNRRSGEFKELKMQPDRERIDRFLHRFKEFTRTQRNKDIKLFIKSMNLRIKGACNYYRWSNTSLIFPYMSYRIFEILWRWAQRKHDSHRGKKWLKDRYWRVTARSAWTFSWEGVDLIDPYECRIRWWKYAKVRIESSPLNMQEDLYWQARNNRRKRSNEFHPSE